MADVTEYAKTLPGVVYATRNLYTCAEDGIAAIKDAIREQDLNRVVVASCTPRTHEPLFRSAREEAGLNTSTSSSSRTSGTSVHGYTCTTGTEPQPRPRTSCA